uniref:Uncharacterized protein n=1 Tax=Ditylenchus dipsaci TaxID=166011 RepID=A0A915DIS4_9BILA
MGFKFGTYWTPETSSQQCLDYNSTSGCQRADENSFGGGCQKKTEANWSDWQPWGDCFCDRQLRTRVCEYEDAYHSKGCQGRSYESRTCISHKPCPNANHHSLKTTTSQPNTATEQYSFTLAPPKGPRYIYAFRPNPLASAHIEK